MDTRKSLGFAVREQLKALLDGGQAHASFEAAVKAFPPKLQGVVPEGLPYSGWQIVEHMRLAQKDILDFSQNTDGNYKPMKWPDSYWPKKAVPELGAWEHALEQIAADRAEFEALLSKATDQELVTTFAWGEGQTLLREAFLIGDHTAYHVGELIVVRRLLGAWK